MKKASVTVLAEVRMGGDLQLDRLYTGLSGLDKLLPVHVGICPPGYPSFVLRNIDGIVADKLVRRLPPLLIGLQLSARRAWVQC